jgi:hypothetical protein
MMLNYHVLVYLALCTYIVTWLMIEGHIFDTPRFLIIQGTGFLRFGGYHLLECRTCFAGWFSLACAATYGDLVYWLPVWAVSRIIQKQERPAE